MVKLLRIVQFTEIWYVGALRALRLVINAENDWRDGHPQVAMHP